MGPRLVGWVRVAIRPRADPAWDSWLLARRSLADPSDRASCVSFAPADTPLAPLVRVAGTRWTSEAGFAAAKGDVGLDHDQVRRWTGWHRPVTLCLLALACLVITQARATALGLPPAPEQSGRLPGAARAGGRHVSSS